MTTPQLFHKRHGSHAPRCQPALPVTVHIPHAWRRLCQRTAISAGALHGARTCTLYDLHDSLVPYKQVPGLYCGRPQRKSVIIYLIS